MQYVSSSDARNHLSKAMDMAQHEPVMVQKQGRDMAVILSAKDYARITQDNIKDLLELTASISRNAVAKGLTEEKLAQLLDEKE